MPYKDYEKQKENARENYYKNKEKKLKQAKEYYYANWEKKQEQRGKWFLNNKEKQAEASKKSTKKWAKKNKDRVKIYRIVKKAVNDGIIIKSEKCEDCQTSGVRIHAHHYNGYSKENYLTIKWLCSKCHKKQHDVRNINLVRRS